MNAVRSKVMEDMKPYMDFAKHRDLIAFVIGEEYFSYDIENDVELEADFAEVIVAVEKDWLFELMKKSGVDNPVEYLQNEYTWDDSIEWFESAKMNGKIAVLEFN